MYYWQTADTYQHTYKKITSYTSVSVFYVSALRLKTSMTEPATMLLKNALLMGMMSTEIMETGSCCTLRNYK
jgi:hypothetical protein